MRTLQPVKYLQLALQQLTKLLEKPFPEHTALAVLNPISVKVLIINS